MPITPTMFSGRKRLLAASQFRPYADVYLTDPLNAVRSATFQCLVDTGSDYTILPISAAEMIGLTPSGPQVRFMTAGGTSFELPSHPSVDLVIEGYRTVGPVVFSAASGFAPILGRRELVSAFDFGMDEDNWYFG